MPVRKNFTGIYFIMRTLVLNNPFLPLSLFPLYTIPSEDAIVRYLNKNCQVVSWYEKKVLTPSRSDLYWPSVIVNYNGHSFRKEVKLKKESLFYRDHRKCVYCGDDLTLQSITFDHLVPRSKGGHHIWENVVAACRKCNAEKSDSLSPRWKPRKKPWRPNFYEMLEIRRKYPIIVYDESWKQFLPNWIGDVIVKKDIYNDSIPCYNDSSLTEK